MSFHDRLRKLEEDIRHTQREPRLDGSLGAVSFEQATRWGWSLRVWRAVLICAGDVGAVRRELGRVVTGLPEDDQEFRRWLESPDALEELRLPPGAVPQRPGEDIFIRDSQH